MKNGVFALALAVVGVAGLAGSAVARSGGGHGGHNGAGPGWPTATPTVCTYASTNTNCCPPGGANACVINP